MSQVHTGHVLCQKCSNRYSGGQARTAEHLTNDHDGKRALLYPLDLVVAERRGGPLVGVIPEPPVVCLFGCSG
jgi:hypothetical protein